MPARPRRPEPDPPRPRPKRKAEQGDNGSHPPDPVVPDELRALTRAIEEVHLAARAAGLPPVTLEWAQGAGVTAEDQQEFERLRRRFDDVEAIGLGPQPQQLAQITEPPDPEAWLIDGLIRPGTLMMISGPPGVAKSWAVRELAYSAAAGLRTFLDHYDIRKRGMRVLILDEDNGDREEWRRELRLIAHLGLQRADLATVWRLSLADVRLDEERWQRWLRGLIVALELDIVILDPISEMHGGKELRDDPAFRSLLGFLKRLKVDYPALGMILVHHTRKRSGAERGAPASLDEVRGQWGQTPDSICVMLPLGDKRSSWEMFKRVPHSKLVLEHQASGGFTAVADQTTGPNRRASTDDRVLAAIDAGGVTVDEIKLGTGLSSSGIYKALRRLGGAGLVTKRAPYQRVHEYGDDLTPPPHEEGGTFDDD